MTVLTPPYPAILVTPREAAEALRVGRTTLYKLLGTGELKSVTVGRARRIRWTDLVSYAADLPDDIS